MFHLRPCYFTYSHAELMVTGLYEVYPVWHLSNQFLNIFNVWWINSRKKYRCLRGLLGVLKHLAHPSKRMGISILIVSGRSNAIKLVGPCRACAALPLISYKLSVVYGTFTLNPPEASEACNKFLMWHGYGLFHNYKKNYFRFCS